MFSRLTFMLLLCFVAAGNLSAQVANSKFIGTDKAINLYSERIKGKDFATFTVDRHNPIQWFDSLEVSWLDKRENDPNTLVAQPGEYFTYQIALWAINPLADVQIKFQNLKGDNGTYISASDMTCFNLGGVNSRGKPFTKKVSVDKDRLQAMWIGIDLDNVQAGTYKGKVTVIAHGKSQTLPLVVKVAGERVANHGYEHGKSMSRMNWLNSTLGSDDRPTKQLSALKRTGKDIDITGRRVRIGADGMLQSIDSYFTGSVQSIGSQAQAILSSPLRFVIEKQDGEIIILKPGRVVFENETPSSVSWKVINTSPEIDMECRAVFEYEGYADYKVSFKAKKPIAVKDIRMEIPMAKDKAEYMMGLHHEGGLRPKDDYRWKWDTTRNQDMLWIGNVNGGLRVKWRAENYRRPLINIYYKFGQLFMPPSWANGGKGGVEVAEKVDNVTVSAYSGSRTIAKGEVLNYDFELLITPFRTIDKEVKYGDRYFHGGGNDESTKVAQAEKVGANIVNIHHASDLYPFINYPYLDENVKDLKRIIDDAHAHNKIMKFYYTTRELTKNTPEFWAFYSLNGEIIFPGPGNESRTYHLHPNGPAQWLKTNIRQRYIPAWYNPIDRGLFKGEVDLSVVTTPDSRLNNFYIGGLNWMVKNMNLDGVYIDDSALDRLTLRRARKIIDDNRPKGRMDLHSCNHYDPYFGYSSCLNMYMELLPYFDLCWIGEGRDYNRMPDHWLIEVSGIPFGLAGQMLQDGGNRWRGMVYGITNRAGWGGDPTSIWKLWDQYRIQDKEMIGYWDKQNPLTVANDMVKATIYKGGKESIIAIAGWGDGEQVCSVDVDWQKLGYDKEKCTIFRPAIEGFQQADEMKNLENITIPKSQGYIIIIRNNE